MGALLLLIFGSPFAAAMAGRTGMDVERTPPGPRALTQFYRASAASGAAGFLPSAASRPASLFAPQASESFCFVEKQEDQNG